MSTFKLFGQTWDWRKGPYKTAKKCECKTQFCAVSTKGDLPYCRQVPFCANKHGGPWRKLTNDQGQVIDHTYYDLGSDRALVMDGNVHQGHPRHVQRAGRSKSKSGLVVRRTDLEDAISISSEHRQSGQTLEGTTFQRVDNFSERLEVTERDFI